MKPINNERTNRTFKLAGGTKENDLPVEAWNGDAATRVHTSYWVPTDAELIKLEDGATITLSVWGLVHPPVALGIGPAPDAEPPVEVDGYQRHGEDAPDVDTLGLDPDGRYEFTGADLVTLLTEVGGAVSGVFLREDPTKVMPTEAILIGLREYVAASPDTFEKAVR